MMNSNMLIFVPKNQSLIYLIFIVDVTITTRRPMTGIIAYCNVGWAVIQLKTLALRDGRDN